MSTKARRRRKVTVWDDFKINPDRRQGKEDESPNGGKHRNFPRVTPSILAAVFESDDYRERSRLFAQFEFENPRRWAFESYTRWFRRRIEDWFLEREQGFAV
jgi:hypothetical protein